MYIVIYLSAAVQHERGPRPSTVQRQVSLFFNDLVPQSGPLVHHNSMLIGQMAPHIDLLPFTFPLVSTCLGVLIYLLNDNLLRR